MEFPTSQPIQNRLHGLDGLRAIACLMVFGVHFGQISQLTGSIGPFDLARFLANGNTGVALFFSLSGFLLSLPYWSALAARTAYPRTSSYLLRRAARILPAYFACLTLLIVLNKYWRELGWQHDVLMHLLLIFNYEDKTIFSINPPFWTLAVESQFYLLLPLLFFLVRKLRPPNAMILMFVVGVVAYAINYMISHVAATPELQIAGVAAKKELDPVLTYSLLAHMPHFILGVTAGWVFTGRRQRQHGSRGNEAFVWLCAAIIFTILATPLDDLLQIPYGRYNLPVVPFLICVVIVLTPQTTLARAFLESPPIRGIGAVSYGVYIYHLPIQHVVARYMRHVTMTPEKDWLIFGVISLALSLIVATLSYWLLEKPVLKFVKGASVRNHQILQGS